MFDRQFWLLRSMLRKIWVRVTGYALLAVAAVAGAGWFGPLLPDTVLVRTGAAAVSDVLDVLASSMLAVTTFSLSVAVSAFAAAAGNATPRATALLQEDHTTQNVLATFLGAFLFSLLGLIALSAEAFDPRARVVLFLVALLVTALVVIALIRWIDHLMSFGRMANTLDRVEAAAESALTAWRADPLLGGRNGAIGGTVGTPVAAPCTGYVQHVDVSALDRCARSIGAEVHLWVRPGAFVARGTTLMRVTGEALDQGTRTALVAAVTLDRARSFDNDPRFGLIVLSEIASRALSPAVNDPGTAIDVIGRVVRLLTAPPPEDAPERAPRHHYVRVLVPPIDPGEMLTDALRPLARDGAANIEVQVRLTKGLQALASAEPARFGATAATLARDAVSRASAAGMGPEDLSVLRVAAGWAGVPLDPDT
jgi:uncharacterized membrane protein